MRDLLNNKPQLGIGIGVACIVIAAAALIYQFADGSGSREPKKAFFSDDDGKTWFADSIERVPPFTDSNGKTAYRVQVYTYAKGKFVGVLERYQPWAKKKLEDIYAQGDQAGGKPTAAGTDILDIQMRGLEAKKPGDTKWQVENSSRIIRDLTAPDGSAIQDSVLP